MVFKIGKKVIHFVKRRRKHSSQRKKGHRQDLTILKVLDIKSDQKINGDSSFEILGKVSKEQKEIIKIFGSLKEQWGKYEASFEKVEDRLGQLSKEIETVKTTRTKAMSRELNKVDNILNSNSIEKGD